MTTDIKRLIEHMKNGIPCAPDKCKVLNEESCMCFSAGATIEALAGEVERIKRVNILPLIHRAEAAEAERDRLKAALVRIASQKSFAELEAGTEDDDVDYDLIGAWDIVIGVARKALGDAS